MSDNQNTVLDNLEGLNKSDSKKCEGVLGDDVFSEQERIAFDDLMKLSNYGGGFPPEFDAFINSIPGSDNFNPDNRRIFKENLKNALEKFWEEYNSEKESVLVDVRESLDALKEILTSSAKTEGIKDVNIKNIELEELKAIEGNGISDFVGGLKEICNDEKYTPEEKKEEAIKYWQAQDPSVFGRIDGATVAAGVVAILGGVSALASGMNKLETGVMPALIAAGAGNFVKNKLGSNTLPDRSNEKEFSTLSEVIKGKINANDLSEDFLENLLKHENITKSAAYLNEDINEGIAYRKTQIKYNRNLITSIDFDKFKKAYNDTSFKDKEDKIDVVDKFLEECKNDKSPKFKMQLEELKKNPSSAKLFYDEFYVLIEHMNTLKVYNNNRARVFFGINEYFANKDVNDKNIVDKIFNGKNDRITQYIN